MVRFFLLCAVLMLSALNATTVLYQSFDDLVEKADGIISGTVSEINYRKKKDDIYTYVTLRDTTVHDGKFDDNEFTFRMLGGIIGNRSTVIPGSPNFNIEEKVILFIRDNGKSIVPIMGWEQGVFKIQNSDLSENYITDANHNLIYDIDKQGKIYKIYKHKSELHLFDGDSGEYIEYDAEITENKKAMNKQSFLKKVKDKVKNKKSKHNIIKNIIIDNDIITSEDGIDIPAIDSLSNFNNIE